MVETQLRIEKHRVATQVRATHLEKNGRIDNDTDDVLDALKYFEAYIDERVANLVVNHPAYPWFSKIKGIGKENIGKVLGPIDITKADSISALWKFCGYHVVDGEAPKRVKGGGKLEWNSQLRSMCWRLSTSLLKARGRSRETKTKKNQASHQIQETRYPRASQRP